MAFKVYTKTGDKGQTSLIGGTRLPKYHIRIEAYGTIDELNSWIGLLRDQSIDAHSIKTLLEVQDRLFTIGSLLAADPEKSKMKLPDIKEADVVLLEKEIDAMEETLPEMKHFVLPGGHTHSILLSFSTLCLSQRKACGVTTCRKRKSRRTCL